MDRRLTSERWPLPDEPLEQVPCLLCETAGHSLLMHGCDRLFARPGYYPIVQCTACGLKYVNRRPTMEALKQHYPDYYFPTRLPQTQTPIQRWYSSVLFGLRWRAYLHSVERVIGRIAADAKVVDVGCGLNGLLVRLARLRGCRGLAVDFKSEIAAYVRDQQGMPVAEGSLEDAHLEEGSVDLVTMNEYLEHEPNPRSVLREARRISRTGAHLVIEVPYSSGIVARTFGSRWSQLDVPRHLAFYTPETLGDILQRSGYRLIYLKSYGAPYSLGVSVLQALGFKRLGLSRLLDVFLVGLAGVPFLPFYPWLHEFLFAVARAEPL